MKHVDLDELLEAFLHAVVKKYPNKYKSFEDLEDDVGTYYEIWKTSPAGELNGLSPQAYIADLAVNKKLFDYVEDILEEDGEVSDLAIEELVKQDGVIDFLKRVAFAGYCDGAAFAGTVLSLFDSGEVEDYFIEVLANPNTEEPLANAAYDYLCDDRITVVDKLLEAINGVEPDVQEVYADILSNYKGDKGVYLWLVTMLYRGTNITLFADLLAKYEDPAAIDILKSFALENDVNYAEYKELRYAVERLGGEMDIDKDFSTDELYKFENNSVED